METVSLEVWFDKSGLQIEGWTLWSGGQEIATPTDWEINPTGATDLTEVERRILASDAWTYTERQTSRADGGAIEADWYDVGEGTYMLGVERS